MDYQEQIRHPGSEILSGADMLKEFGYTDTGNPYVGFDLMNDSNFKRLKACIENKSNIPDEYNANIIRLRDYRLGSMINDFREMCNGELYRYEEAWAEYRAEYNPSMPEEFYEFWLLYDTVTIGKILPLFINLIDPISMKWIDLEYSKVKVDNKGKYHYEIEKPILTSDPTFLYPDTEMEYESHKPDYVIGSICEELAQEVQEYFPVWLLRVEYMNNQLEHGKPKPNESDTDFLRRTKWEVRRRIQTSKKAKENQ